MCVVRISITNNAMSYYGKKKLCKTISMRVLRGNGERECRAGGDYERECRVKGWDELGGF